MQMADFTRPAGTFSQTLQGVPAFVPNTLHPSLDVATIALPLSEAMQAIGELRGACRRLQNPYVLIRPLQRQEALTSSAMEGTFTTEDELLLAEVGAKPGHDDATQEVVNYLRALDKALEMLETLPLCHRVIQEAHRILLSGLSSTREAFKHPGQYKTEQNWIGGLTIESARFVPAPPDKARICMDQLEAYVNRENRDYPTPLMDLALVHYQLEAIHPFADGNGRVGRMLISLMAVQSGLLAVPVLYMSPVMERWKTEYVDRMYSVSSESRWGEWLKFFFARLTESCRETVATIDRLLTLQEELREKARKAGRSGTLMTLVDHLFERPALTVNEAAVKLHVTYAAARSAVEKLVQLGILHAVQDTYPRLYISGPIRRAARPAPPGDPG